MIPAKAMRTMEEQGEAIVGVLASIQDQQDKMCRFLRETTNLLTEVLEELKKGKKP